MKKNKTIAIAMSGGVDSSVAAALLKEQGYDIFGVHMKLWSFLEVGGNVNHESGCCSLDSVYDCRLVSGALDIPFYTFDFSETFEHEVIDNFKSEYLKGRTPNPCVICNTKIKWEHFIKKCLSYGADYIATGHYAKIAKNEDNGRYAIVKGDYDKKDQSYYLWGLKQDSLSKTIFPVGELTKPEVREIAEKNNFRTANKPESQEICFVKDNNYKRFLKEQIPELEEKVTNGKMIDTNGETIRNHEGYPFYTIGQRKGLGGGFKEPKYVVDIDAKENKIIIGSNEDLLSDGLIAQDINFQWIEKISEPIEAFVMIRYNDTPKPAKIEQIDKNRLKITFNEARKAVTPGQSTVIYDNEGHVLAGGLIETSFKIER
jgi:tRNA-specific 2-thiouridylase